MDASLCAVFTFPLDFPGLLKRARYNKFSHCMYRLYVIMVATTYMLIKLMSECPAEATNSLAVMFVGEC